MLEVSAEIAAPPEAAWDLLTHTRTWTGWGPTVSGVDPPDGEIGPGARGRVRTPLGVWLPFEITRFEPPHVWAWKVAGIPATRHRVEATTGGCRVTFELPAVVFPYAVVCRLGLRRIARMLEAPG